MTSSSLDASIRRAAEEADLYEQTVHALLTFAAYVTHDGDARRPMAHFGFGRRMDTSEENRVQPSNEVTPDLVAQKSAEYGVVAEVKAGLAAGELVWEQHAQRLEKYDDALVGWWTDTETVSTIDVLLLIHRSRSRQFVRYLQECPAEKHKLSERVSVVEFVRSNAVETYYSFRKELGEIHDADLAPRLEDTAEIPLTRVIMEFAQIQFYDAEPPLPMLLEVLWGEFFSRVSEVEFDEVLNCWPLQVDVDSVTDDLQRAYGSQALKRDERSCAFPQVSWVREAMNQLTGLGLARLEKDGTYTVFLRVFRRGDLRSEFVTRLQRRMARGAKTTPEPTPDQTSLPLELE